MGRFKSVGVFVGLVGLMLLPLWAVPQSGHAVSDTTVMAVFGDSGMDANALGLFDRIGADHPDLVADVGDLSYVGREADYCQALNSRIAAPIEIIPGNHEGLDEAVGGGDGDMAKFAACLPDRMFSMALTPGGYPYNYWFDTGQVRVIMISPHIVTAQGTLSYANGTVEQASLRAAIQEGHAAGRWVIVAHHEPYLSLGEHAGDSSNMSSPELAAAEISAGADLVVAGHDHNYSRSQQLTGPVTSQTSPTVAAAGSAFNAGVGTVFAVVGNAGHSPRGVSALTPIWAAAFPGTTLGYGLVEATASTLTFQEKGVDGRVLDQFTISRPPAPSPTTAPSEPGAVVPPSGAPSSSSPTSASGETAAASPTAPPPSTSSPTSSQAPPSSSPTAPPAPTPTGPEAQATATTTVTTTVTATVAVTVTVTAGNPDPAGQVPPPAATVVPPYRPATTSPAAATDDPNASAADEGTEPATAASLGAAVTVNGSINTSPPGQSPVTLPSDTSQVTVTFTATNSGRSPLAGVTISDERGALNALNCPARRLEPTATMSCIGQLPAPQPGVEFTDTGTVTGTPVDSNNNPVADRVSAHTTLAGTVAVNAHATLATAINGEAGGQVTAAAGSTMHLTYTVTNDGNVTLTNLAVTDDQHAAIDCPESRLAVGATMTCAASVPAPPAGAEQTHTATLTALPVDAAGATMAFNKVAVSAAASVRVPAAAPAGGELPLWLPIASGALLVAVLAAVIVWGVRRRQTARIPIHETASP